MTSLGEKLSSIGSASTVAAPPSGSAAATPSGPSGSAAAPATGAMSGWLKYLLILMAIGFLLLGVLYYFAKPYLATMGNLLSLLGYGSQPKPAAVIDKKTPTGAGAASSLDSTTTAADDSEEESSTTTTSATTTTPKIKNIKPRQRSNSAGAAAVPMPDDAGSSTQASKAKSKAGFCYIGEDRGFRSCIKVGEGDKCMSGDIFPTQALCINPKLRQ